ncbi:MAG: IclR family transcriptional regulator [Acidobacteriaceae bacterium]|nr:IclR family transcriptional regulator [Acidobacteriaceae bacterium]
MASKTKPEQNYAVPALEKGLDVLELLARQSEGLTKSQLARELNRTVSEIFRMLVCLERRGYIAAVDEERYTLTLKLFKLVQQHPPTERLIVDALPIMNRLAIDTRQSCHLGVLEGGQVVIVAQTNAPTNTGFYVKLGSQVDMMEAASGYVILARQSPEVRASMIEEWTQRSGKRAPADLNSHLDRIRKAGYEKRASYTVKGIINISYPVLDDRGVALGALTVPYIQHSESPMELPQIIERLRKAAGEITAAMGGRLDPA